MAILLVSPDFAPSKTVGALRMTSLARYLCMKGEKVIVLRNNPKLYDRDGLEIEEIKNLTIIEVNKLAGYFEMARLYKQAIEDILNTKPVDIIIYSCGPYFSLYVAPQIKKKYGIAYIIDFRDLWIYTFFEKIIVKILWKLTKPIKRFIERECIKDADQIVVVTPGDKILIEKHYKHARNKTEVIFNGFDDAVLSNSLARNIKLDSGYTNIGMCGKFFGYSEKYARHVLIALNNLDKQGVKVRLYHIGTKEPQVSEGMKQLNISSDIYHYMGYMEYRNCLEFLKQMDLNMLVYVHPVSMSTKVFDYTYCNRPIILSGKDDTYLAQYIKSFSGGFVSSTIKDIEKNVVEVMETQQKVLSHDQSQVNRYGRSIQNKKYHGLIRKIIEQEKINELENSKT